MQSKRKATARNGFSSASVRSDLKELKSGCQANGNFNGDFNKNKAEGCNNVIAARAFNGDAVMNCASATNSILAEANTHRKTFEDGVSHTKQQQDLPQGCSMTATGTAIAAKTGCGDSATANATYLKDNFLRRARAWCSYVFARDARGKQQSLEIGNVSPIELPIPIHNSCEKNY